ncbi:hypothetical protein GGF37_003650, partial [Kickxella alabastrina]
MQSHRDLVDVLLLPDCNIYERYPELLQRVDYFLHNWTEDQLTRTESLLRKQSRGQRNTSSELHNSRFSYYSNNGDDEAFTHARSLNIAWRQFAVLKLQLPSPVGSPLGSPLYSPAESIRENMSTSSFASDITLEEGRSRLRFNDCVEQCMVVFKHEKEYLPTDCEDDGDEEEEEVEAEAEAGMRYRGKAQMRRPGRRGAGRRSLVIKLEPAHLKGDHRMLAQAVGRPFVGRQYSDSDEEEDPFDDYSLALYTARQNISERTVDRYIGGSNSNNTAVVKEQGIQQQGSRGVSGYVQGYVQSVAGQVRKFVTDAVSVSTFAADKPLVEDTPGNGNQTPVQRNTPPPPPVVADPFASSNKYHQFAKKKSDQGVSFVKPSVDTKTNASHVLRDPFATNATSYSSSTLIGSEKVASVAGRHVLADSVPFDDDEDAIIQEFEREMSKYGNNHHTPYSSSSWSPYTSSSGRLSNTTAAGNELMIGGGEDSAGWGVEYDYESEYQMYDDADYGCKPTFSLYGTAASAASAAVAATTTPIVDYGVNTGTSVISTQQQQQQQHYQHQHNRARNESIIDRAEDTIVNTVDAVK